MNDIRPAIGLLVLFTIICGGIYPAAVTGMSGVLFPRQANGSFMVDRSGRETGSRLIGQPFSADRYFWPRPSATAVFGYNPAASGGSNAGPTNPDYLKTVGERIRVLRAAGITGPIPGDLVQASASGLDPHISPQAAQLQIPRVARARGVSERAVAELVARATADRQFGIFGDPRVNVLDLNLGLDTLRP